MQGVEVVLIRSLSVGEGATAIAKLADFERWREEVHPRYTSHRCQCTRPRQSLTLEPERYARSGTTIISPCAPKNSPLSGKKRSGALERS